jgi:hypothetical protein
VIVWATPLGFDGAQMRRREFVLLLVGSIACGSFAGLHALAQAARLGERAGMGFPIYPHMLHQLAAMPVQLPNTIRVRFRPECGTRNIQHTVPECGTRNIQHTVRYTELASDVQRFLAVEASCDGLEHGSSGNSNLIRPRKQTFEASQTVGTMQRAS